MTQSALRFNKINKNNKNIFDNSFKCVIALPQRGDNVTCIDESWELDLSEYKKINEFKFNSPVSVHASAQWLEQALLSVSISVKFNAETECARCLKPVALAIYDKLMYLYYLRGLELGADTELASDDGFMPVEVEHFGRVLDIAPQVWETILLLLPFKVLCKEDCAGLCPICGADLNENPCSCSEDNGDPRFSVLKNFKIE